MLDIKKLPVYKNPNIKIKVSKKKTKHMDTLYKSNKLKHDVFGVNFMNNYFNDLKSK
jgi:hypothetical protein|tara:strand:+ start:362 stop:532 length:171 start_codon:yes stop_codon:yes gene_type:complete